MMLDELESCRLTVCKIRTEDGWIRVPLTRNADWYREFCAEYVTPRRDRRMKARTIIKRCHTESALNRIARGKIETEYARRLLPRVVERAKEIPRITNARSSAVPEVQECVFL